jgi:hypothetical protein
VLSLESALSAIRQHRAPEVGHNRGPDSFEPWSDVDESEIQSLIALLKQQTPTSIVRREELVTAANRASEIADKTKEYVDDFFKAAAKRGGEKFGENLFSPTWWLGVATAITLIVEAVRSLLSLF